MAGHDWAHAGLIVPSPTSWPPALASSCAALMRWTQNVHFSMVAVIRHRHRFGKTLGLVVDAPRSDRVDIAPVRFLLWVFERIAIDL